MMYNNYLEYLLRICNCKDFLHVYLYISILYLYKYHIFSLYCNNIDIYLVLLVLYLIETFKEWPVMLTKLGKPFYQYDDRKSYHHIRTS